MVSDLMMGGGRAQPPVKTGQLQIQPLAQRQVQAASGLQGIGGAQPPGWRATASPAPPQRRERHNQQIRLGKQSLKTIQAGLIAPPQ